MNEFLDKLSKVLRYAGLNVPPSMLQVMLDPNVRKLVDTLADALQANPNLELDKIDEIVDAIQQAAIKQQEDVAKAKAAAANKKKPSLEQA